jgi:outer membrane protein TolC
MTMKNLKLIGFLLSTWLGSGGLVLAQEATSAPATVELTLQKAEELALAGNPHIHAADDRARAAEKEVFPAFFPEDPMVMVDTTNPGMQMWMVEEKMGFPGKGAAKADVKGAEARGMRAEALGTRRSIVLQAQQAYWEFYYRGKVDAILQEAQSRWKNLAQVLQSKELTGQWLSVKAVRMQMETAKALNGLITNSRALKVSQFNLNHLFSLPHFTAYRLGGEPTLPPFSGNEEELVRRALGHNSEIISARSAIEAKEARQNMATLDYLPDLDVWLSGVRDPNNGSFSNYGFRLGVSVPLFFPAKQMQESGAASDELSATKYDLQGKQNEVIHMVEDAYVNADSAWRILKLYEEGGLVKQTQRAWAATQTAYRNEGMSLPDYIETYNTYVETLTNYYQAQADYGKALAELEYQVGESKGEGK